MAFTSIPTLRRPAHRAVPGLHPGRAAQFLAITKPVTHGVRHTTRQTLLYALGLFAVTCCW
jgi:hypothetical protein